METFSTILLVAQISDLTYTATRQMAQSAAQKAADAYAAARQAVSRLESLEARLGALEVENAELRGRIAVLERPAVGAPRQKAA
jgi:hypothetical protein